MKDVTIGLVYVRPNEVLREEDNILSMLSEACCFSQYLDDVTLLVLEKIKEFLTKIYKRAHEAYIVFFIGKRKILYKVMHFLHKNVDEYKLLELFRLHYNK